LVLQVSQSVPPEVRQVAQVVAEVAQAMAEAEEISAAIAKTTKSLFISFLRVVVCDCFLLFIITNIHSKSSDNLKANIRLLCQNLSTKH